jgi:cellobiose phosphorylase
MSFDGKISALTSPILGIMTVKSSIIHKRFGWLCYQTFKRVKRVSEDNTQKRRKDSHFEIYVEDLKFYNSDLEFVASGQFDVYIGASSDSDKKVSFELNK